MVDETPKPGDAPEDRRDGGGGPSAGGRRAGDAGAGAGGSEGAAAEAVQAAMDAAADAAAARDAEGAGNPEVGEEGDPRMDLQAALAAATAERDELRDRLYRALAETENVRKRAERDVKDARQLGGDRLARDLLAVHDNLNRALGAADDDMRAAAGPVIEGVELTRKELLSAFAKHGIEPVAPEPGDRFDPKFHEAMFEAPAPGAAPGTVFQVLETGFTISGRLLRAAKVGVASAQSGDAGGAAASRG